MDNSIKYSHDNSQIILSANNNYQGDFNPSRLDGVLIQVMDSGVGIKEKDVKHLFERFFRSEDVKNIQGTGLGLSIAKELIELHEGHIAVQSEYGKGTTFFVFLPRGIQNIKEKDRRVSLN